MELMGERAWQLPAWLDRRLPHTSLEGTAELPATGDADAPAPAPPAARPTPVAAGERA